MIVVHFFVQDLMDKFEEIEIVEDSLEGVDEYVEDSIEIVEDSIEELEESDKVVQDSLEKVEDIYLVYVYEFEIFGFNLLYYIIFV